MIIVPTRMHSTAYDVNDDELTGPKYTYIM